MAEPQPPEGLRKIALAAGAKALVADETYGDLVPLEYGPGVAEVVTDAVLAAVFEACTVREHPHMWLHCGIRTGRRLTLSFPLPDEPMPEAGPMHPDLAAALARAKAQAASAREPSDRGQTPSALVALGQDSTTGTIPTEEPR